MAFKQLVHDLLGEIVVAVDTTICSFIRLRSSCSVTHAGVSILPTLIRTKRAAGRSRDLEPVAELEALGEAGSRSDGV
ncbi:MAG TPA: hypothetical protein VGA37_02740 [Gemmatimonadales bacterium]